MSDFERTFGPGADVDSIIDRINRLNDQECDPARIEDGSTVFASDFSEASMYAKKYPGSVFTRTNCGEHFLVLIRFPQLPYFYIDFPKALTDDEKEKGCRIWSELNERYERKLALQRRSKRFSAYCEEQRKRKEDWEGPENLDELRDNLGNLGSELDPGVEKTRGQEEIQEFRPSTFVSLASQAMKYYPSDSIQIPLRHRPKALEEIRKGLEKDNSELVVVSPKIAVIVDADSESLGAIVVTENRRTYITSSPGDENFYYRFICES
ncbi:hypothetical protein IMZ29_18590 [Achromobacter sp. GG226]|uniref:hypothetical protein n=1 Tax=Verticiella alkaliphila TaxID=2779529 RepID=UPI001C0D7756|nr:hypothetical protein [Verticiella sp. GG226]MBU4612479.1 hypothetical protein [Verticiella sp. GG226]